MAAWSIVNLIRSFCDKFTIIVPFHCHSAGTIISLGANEIIMTKQATLGPIDPSYNSALNPASPFLREPHPVSIEQVNGYFQFLESKQIINEENKTRLIVQLAEKIHPLVLGQIHKTNSQIKRIADRLMSFNYSDKEIRENAINFLCSDSGSHDYTINRKEARDNLKLSIKNPDDSLYGLLKELYDDFHDELMLSSPFIISPDTLNGRSSFDYDLKLCILEGTGNNNFYFSHKGKTYLTDDSNNPFANILTDMCWLRA